MDRRELLGLGVAIGALAATARVAASDAPASPEWLSFSDCVNGSAMLLHFSGNVLQRV
jgi:hypothetical protein